jgi:hypothetical protein
MYDINYTSHLGGAKIITGYKATDKNIRCLGYQFVPGQWHEHEGKVELCESGFHFCPDVAGPLYYYEKINNLRLWKVEAEFVEKVPEEAGVTTKYVARRIRLVEEVKVPRSKNFGGQNIGLYNIGIGNTGSRNKGGRNTGFDNNGSWNTGGSNYGSFNSGDANRGMHNSGSYNTGDYNTGSGNIGDGHSGFYCIKPAIISCFDKPTKYTYKQFKEHFYYEIYALNSGLKNNGAITWGAVKTLPNITLPKLRALVRQFNKINNSNVKIFTK